MVLVFGRVGIWTSRRHYCHFTCVYRRCWHSGAFFETSRDTQWGCTPGPHYRGASRPVRAFRLKSQRQRGFPVHTFPQIIMEPTNTLPIPVRYEIEGDISISNKSPSPIGDHSTRIGGGPSLHQSSDDCAQGYVHTGFLFCLELPLKYLTVLQMRPLAVAQNERTT